MSCPIRILILPEKLAAKMCGSAWRALGAQFGLKQFGVNLETLAPGGQSSLRHWHTETDEFVYVISGALILKTDDGESLLTQGMCVGFRAGVENAHHLLNRADADATFLVVGTRNANDKVFYPDDDLQWLQGESGTAIPARKDGSLYD
jgi:uncharacterized cupin superfamily protein